MSLIIRPVLSSDTPALVKLWEIVFPEYTDPTKPQRDPTASIARKLAMQDGLFWLASSQDIIIGSIMAGWDGHRGWIYSLGVAPPFRQQGVGRQLAYHAEYALRARGCPKINLQTRSNDAIKFWQSIGFADDAVTSLGKQLAP
jgi:ribosomal protein S18 acetylase RimI-like enzyme